MYIKEKNDFWRKLLGNDDLFTLYTKGELAQNPPSMLQFINDALEDRDEQTKQSNAVTNVCVLVSALETYVKEMYGYGVGLGRDKRQLDAYTANLRMLQHYAKLITKSLRLNEDARSLAVIAERETVLFNTIQCINFLDTRDVDKLSEIVADGVIQITAEFVANQKNAPNPQ